MNGVGESSEIYVGIRSEIVREEVDIVLNSSYPVARPNKNAKVKKFKRKVETVPVSDKTVESRIEKSIRSHDFDDNLPGRHAIVL